MTCKDYMLIATVIRDAGVELAHTDDTDLVPSAGDMRRWIAHEMAQQLRNSFDKAKFIAACDLD